MAPFKRNLPHKLTDERMDECKSIVPPKFFGSALYIYKISATRGKSPREIVDYCLISFWLVLNNILFGFSFKLCKYMFIMDTIHRIKNNEPMPWIFLSGGAGVGKTMIINYKHEHIKVVSPRILPLNCTPNSQNRKTRKIAIFAFMALIYKTFETAKFD